MWFFWPLSLLQNLPDAAAGLAVAVGVLGFGQDFIGAGLVGSSRQAISGFGGFVHGIGNCSCNQCCHKKQTFFEYAARNSRPSSETVGNGLCAVPGT